MGDIYRGALVAVVAATAEITVSDSLLRVQPQDQNHTWRTTSLRKLPGDGSRCQIQEEALESTWLHSDAADTHFDWSDERGASKKNCCASCCLVFCEDEVVWECRSCCLCECGGEQEHFSGGEWMRPYQQMLLPLAERDTLTAFAQLPFTEHEPFLDGTLTALAQLPFAEHEPLQLDGTSRYFADAEAAYSFWEDAVENYSRRKLTLKTDRLPAISAVASVVAEATGDCYLAGLWRNDLLAGLAWIASSGNDTTRLPKYIAPTWSWTSMSTSVWYDFERHWRRTRHLRDADLDASVLDAWTALEGQNPCGPVSDV